MAVVFNETSLTTPKTIFWTNQGLHVKGAPDAHIPGVNDVGNQRPMKMSLLKMREVKVKSTASEVKAKHQGTQMRVNKTAMLGLNQLKPSPEKIDLTKSEKEDRVIPAEPPSLKDLRAEDKLRVANLIKELAKIGEEKEKAVEQMHTERVSFEKQILSLLEQQELILKDRQNVQTQLEKYQIHLDQVQHMEEQNQPVKGSPKQKVPNEKKSSPLKVDCHSNPASTSSSESKEEEDDIQLKNRRKSHRKHERSWSSNQIVMSCKSDSESQEIESHKSPKAKRQLVRPQSDDLNQTMRDLGVKVGSKSNPKFKDTTRSRVKESQISSVRGENFPRSRQKELLIDFNKYQNGFDVEDNEKQTDAFKTPPRRSRPSDIKRKLLSHGPLPEPIMSSTQKSSEIYEEMSFKSRSSPEHFYPLQLDSDPRTTRQSFTELSPHRHRSRNTRQAEKINRVNFRSEKEFSDDCQMHSPNLYGNAPADLLDDADPKFIAYYRKLSPRRRKQELLSQRNTLLEEQNRLRHILIEQENMLKLKREQLRQQQMVQAQRLAHFEQTGEFPLADRNTFRDDFEPAVRTLRTDNFTVPRLSVQRADNPTMGDNHDQNRRTDQPDTLSKSKSPHRVQLVSTATSPLPTSPDRRLSMAASPLTTPPRQEKTTPTKTYTDAATSYSVAIETQTDLSLTSPGTKYRQGNLPLSTNRQRSNFNQSAQLNTSIDRKGFSVLEILEKMDSPSNSSRSSQRSFHSDPGGALSPRTKGINSNIVNESGHVSHHSVSEDESLAELEESKVLEDIFFLK